MTKNFPEHITANGNCLVLLPVKCNLFVIVKPWFFKCTLTVARIACWSNPLIQTVWIWGCDTYRCTYFFIVSCLFNWFIKFASWFEDLLLFRLNVQSLKSVHTDSNSRGHFVWLTVQKSVIFRTFSKLLQNSFFSVPTKQQEVTHRTEQPVPDNDILLLPSESTAVSLQLMFVENSPMEKWKK